MYESPINLVVQDIETQMVQKEEQTILEAIKKYDVVVDKDELIKAINYDRNQYSKGYKDGVNNILDKIRAEIEEYKSRQLALAIGVKDLERGKQIALECVLAILDKYKAKSEEQP